MNADGPLVVELLNAHRHRFRMVKDLFAAFDEHPVPLAHELHLLFRTVDEAVRERAP